MPIDVSETTTITCDHCGRTIDPTKQQAFRVRIVAEAGDGKEFSLVQDKVAVLCPTDALSAWAFVLPAADPPVIPPYPN